MNLFHLLSNLPHEQLQRLADEFGVSSLTPSKRNILQAITVRYRDHNFLAGILAGLPHSCSGLLRALVFFTPPKESEITIPESIENAWCGCISMIEHIDTLCERGLLFRDAQNPEKVLLPGDIRRQMRALFLSQFKKLKPLKYIAKEDIQPREVYLESVYHLLCLLRRIRARMTQKGTIHKKVYERWEERFGGMTAHQQAFDFAFEFCVAHGLLKQRHNRYTTTRQAGEWFAQSPLSMRHDLWEFLLDWKILRESAFQKLMVILLTAEEEMQKDKLYPVFSLQEVDGEFHRHTRAEESLKPSVNSSPQEILESLEAIGLIFFDTHEGEKVFGFTPIGAHLFFDCPYEEESKQEGCILQPSFQILVPPHVGYKILWKLDFIAEFKRRDVMTEFVITQHSIVEALRSGFLRDEIGPFLENICDGGIPENVRYSLGEWCNKYGQIKLSRKMVVECVSEELANEIMHIPEVKEIVDERISARHFVLPETQARELLKLLQDYGYEPSAGHKVMDEEK